MPIYHMLRAFLLLPMFDGWGPYLFVFIEAIVASWLSVRWYNEHKGAMGNVKAANRATWLAAFGFALALVSIVVWARVP